MLWSGAIQYSVTSGSPVPVIQNQLQVIALIYNTDSADS